MTNGPEPGSRVFMSRAETGLFIASLSGSKRYLEFGVGGSTEIAIQDPDRRIVSVETDKKWLAEVRRNPKIAEAEKQGRLAFEHVDIGPVKRWGYPTGEIQFRNWPKYHTVPFDNHDYHYDAILIDGRFRVSCALAAYSFIDDSAVLMFHDYPNRTWYSEVEKFYDTVAIAESLYVFKKRPLINHRSLYTAIMKSMFDFR